MGYYIVWLLNCQRFLVRISEGFSFQQLAITAGRERQETPKQKHALLRELGFGEGSRRIEKMKLSKDKTSLIYNDFLTVSGIPPKVFDYRLDTRSALEWIVDQYCVKTDKRSGIVNDPNRADDPQSIVKLIGKVITVSLETVEIVSKLPALEIME